MSHSITINGRRIGPGEPVYLVAEMSANHHQSFDEAVRIMEAAKAAGADAVKIQTYTADTMTIDSQREWFRVGKGTIWEGKNLHALYREAMTPWDWYPRLRDVADRLGLDLFSTPFDASAVEFLDGLDTPVMKVASFEVVDLPLLRRIGATKRPVIMSTGMASLAEIDEAVRTLRAAGCVELALLKCTSAYPTPPEEVNLRTIPHLAEAFGVVSGLSDHTMGTAVPVAAVAMGACLIEKHFTMSRAVAGPDSLFSLEPAEFEQMAKAVRIAEKALGQVSYEVTEAQIATRAFRRSLFVVHDMVAGEVFTEENVRVIRPGYGLLPKALPQVLGRRATKDIAAATPLSWEMIG